MIDMARFVTTNSPAEDAAVEAVQQHHSWRAGVPWPDIFTVKLHAINLHEAAVQVCQLLWRLPIYD